MRSARLVAQCKINLFLHILAREASGYHQLETLFCRLALGDLVTVRLGGRERSLDCRGERMPTGGLGPIQRNLAWRAAVAFAEAVGMTHGWAIEIDKKIPVGGGLGGGSADAGAVLRLLNALVPSPLPEEALLGLAGSLGADVPFLTQSTSTLAFGWGRGDRLLPLPALSSRRCALVCFPFGVPTADAYRWLAESPAQVMGAAMYRPRDLSDWEGVGAVAHNAFERVVAPRFPAIAEMLAAARADSASRAGALTLMSGSGSTVFALPSDGEVAWERGAEAEAVTACIRRTGATVVQTETASAVEQVELLD